jgi:hypothetical protein
MCCPYFTTHWLAAGLALAVALPAAAQEVVAFPRETEPLKVMPRVTANPGPNHPAVRVETALRKDGTYEAPFGDSAAPAVRLRPLLKALDPTTRAQIDELILDEELRAFEWFYLQRYGFQGKETLEVKPREVRGQ